MPRSASVVGLAKRGVIPRKQLYIKLLVFNTVILVTTTPKLSTWSEFTGTSIDRQALRTESSAVLVTTLVAHS